VREGEGRTEIDRLLAVSRALDTKLLVVMMSMHASEPEVVWESSITVSLMICDVFRISQGEMTPWPLVQVLNQTRRRVKT
jgi:hypothetical protein